MSLTDTDGFLARFLSIPFDSADEKTLDDVLAPASHAEQRLRRAFAGNEAIGDPYIGLMDIFSLPHPLRLTRARQYNHSTEADGHCQSDWAGSYLFPLPYSQRRAHLDPFMVADLDTFNHNFHSFTLGVLQNLTWSNVIVAGGSVLACLSPPPSYITRGRTGDYYHSGQLRSSDLDLFLYGLTEDEAKLKMLQIFTEIQDAVPFKVIAVRKKHTVTILSQYPFRPVQVVLRLYQSPAEVLSGFDIDAPCVLYNGTTVFANPRAIMAMARQCNTIDITRRSPSYEYRLSKYAKRGFEVRLPSLQRNMIKEMWYDDNLSSPLPTGLARLIILEALSVGRRYDRIFLPRPNKLGGKDRAQLNELSLDIVGAVSFYDAGLVRIPYGPFWNATKIEKLVKSKQARYDWLSQFDFQDGKETLTPKFLVGHFHGLFAGTMEECIQNICPDCPAADWEWDPAVDLFNESIQGPLIFITDDPGRQLFTGSFHPIADHISWEEQAYRSESPVFPFEDCCNLYDFFYY